MEATEDGMDHHDQSLDYLTYGCAGCNYTCYSLAGESSCHR